MTRLGEGIRKVEALDKKGSKVSKGRGIQEAKKCEEGNSKAGIIPAPFNVHP